MPKPEDPDKKSLAFYFINPDNSAPPATPKSEEELRAELAEEFDKVTKEADQKKAAEDQIAPLNMEVEESTQHSSPMQTELTQESNQEAESAGGLKTSKGVELPKSPDASNVGRQWYELGKRAAEVFKTFTKYYGEMKEYIEKQTDKLLKKPDAANTDGVTNRDRVSNEKQNFINIKTINTDNKGLDNIGTDNSSPDNTTTSRDNNRPLRLR